MQMCHLDVHTFSKSVGSAWNRRYQKDNCRRSFPFRDVLILHISRESQDDCLHADFGCFKLALRLTWKFMNFWSFLTPPGDKHDERSAIGPSPPKLSRSKLTILPWDPWLLNFSHNTTLNLMVFSEILFWNEMFLCSIKWKCLVLLNRKWFKRLPEGFARHLSAICSSNVTKWVRL